MKNLLLLIALLVTQAAFAVPIRRLYQNIKLPSQSVMDSQIILNPVAATTDSVLAVSPGSSGTTAAVTVTSFLAQPDVPRNIVIRAADTTADVAACNIVVSGTDIYNDSLSETFAFANNQSSAINGSRAFKTLTSIVWPDSCEDGGYLASWNVGVGEKLGLYHCLDKAGHVVMSNIDGAYETTRPTISIHSTQVSGNLSDFNGTMDGASDFEIFFINNFKCFP